MIALADPRYTPIAQLNLGTIEYNVKCRPTVAKELWEKAYRDPRHDLTTAMVAHNLGTYWEQKRDMRRARQYFLEARRVWPDGEEPPDRLRHL